MELPHCPACQTGHLLPLSGNGGSFCFWACSSPGCSYVVSSSGVAVKYYKGSAVQEERDDGAGKKWTEFSF